MTLLIRLYRSWPLRPRCHAAEGRHTWLCRAAGLLIKGEPIVPDCKHRK